MRVPPHDVQPRPCGGSAQRRAPGQDNLLLARPLSHPVRRGLPVVVTSVPSDSHNWNLVFLQLVLEELGHQVANLGPCVPDGLLIAECLRLRPALVVVSTVNGHGFFDGMRLIRRFRARQELAAIPVVIGGKLGIDGSGGEWNRRQMLSAGFDAVYEDGAASMVAFRSYVGRLTASVNTSVDG